MSFKEVGSENSTNFNIILLLKDGFYHWNLSLKFYAWIVNEFKIPSSLIHRKNSLKDNFWAGGISKLRKF